MFHSKQEILKVANTLSHKLIALETDVLKELNMDSDMKFDAVKYQLADLVALARMITADLGPYPFEDE